MSCKFPEHHKSAGHSSGVPVFAIAAAALAVYVVVRLVLVVVRLVEVWWWVPVAALAAVAAVFGVVQLVRRRRVGVSAIKARGLPRWLRHLPRALWAAVRWRRLAADLGLGKVRHPRAIVHPSSHGVVLRVRTVPGVGRLELDKNAEHLSNALRCVRMSVTQPRLGGRVVVSGVRRDPLLEPLPASVLTPFDGRHVLLGRDEWGKMRRPDLGNLSGSAWSGNPGRGKSEAALSLAVQLAPSPLVDTWILDGGACDWAPFAEGAAGYVGDDLEAAEDMLRVLDTLMGDRRRNLQADRGVRNGWALGPAEDYRLQWVLIEEAPFYFDDQVVKGDRKREGHVRACRGLVAGLLRRGRAPMFHVSMVAQKATGTGGLPPDLRDLCGLRWSFGLATTDSAAAILGDDIRKHETMSPTLLQGPEHVGIASCLLRTGQSPYTLVKFPAVGQDRADEVAADLAARSLGHPVPVDSSDPEPVAALGAVS